MGCVGAKPHRKGGGLGAKLPSLGNFHSYIAYVLHPKPQIPKGSLSL